MQRWGLDGLGESSAHIYLKDGFDFSDGVRGV